MEFYFVRQDFNMALILDFLILFLNLLLNNNMVLLMNKNNFILCLLLILYLL